jgi:hypothetical protein
VEGDHEKMEIVWQSVPAPACVAGAPPCTHYARLPACWLRGWDRFEICGRAARSLSVVAFTGGLVHRLQ